MPFIPSRDRRFRGVIISDTRKELNIINFFEIEGFGIKPPVEIEPLSQQFVCCLRSKSVLLWHH